MGAGSLLIELRRKECGARTLIFAGLLDLADQAELTVRGGLRAFETPPGVVVAFGGPDQQTLPVREGSAPRRWRRRQPTSSPRLDVQYRKPPRLDHNARLDVPRPGARDRQTP